ncbi:MAG TPA: long-chain fatty acid--CoA ligase [Nocardioidaceae bacterium]|nr:long-chain fatty acid--CoA ligase [Nocardioidaceae bacterium]
MSTSKTVCDAFQQIVKVEPDAVAMRTPGDTVSITWREYDERVRKIAAGLDRLGLKRGDTLAFMLVNRPEFALVDTAGMHLGATCFSVYNTSSPEQLNYLFSHAENKIVVTEKAFLDRILKCGVSIEHVICIDGPADGATGTLADLESGDPRDGFDFDAAWQAVQPEDVCTLIYTSGTTGPPKGVQTTHANIVAEVTLIKPIAPIHFGDRQTSFLPAAHIADRVSTLYFMAFYGIQVTYIDDPKGVLPALLDCRPTVWFAVPRVWEKIRAGIEAKVNAEPDEAKRKIALDSIAVGRLKARSVTGGEPLTAEQQEQWELAEAFVLGNLRAAIGLDQCRYAWTGAAALAPDTLEFFIGLGIKLCELWGMSETTGIATINPPEAIRVGSVGIAVPGVEVKLAEDGEIMVRGPINMAGYRKDPEKTAETLNAEGWILTGDIGVLDDEGYFKIVDRKKELIINAGGKNMSPTNIENSVKAACPLIGGIIAIGDNRAYNVALIALDPDAAAMYAERVGISPDPAVLAKDAGVLAIVAKGVEDGNTKLSRVEQIKKFELLSTFWEPGGTELTPTMKLRRKPINEKYSAEIEALYA